ncbi:C6 transcription factor protein [Rutstroemia sp. NJR-2017a BVV2]|nr:C6 transcription factor protein [Rutstroemia sp. NJR-2017a BVV2]
MLGAAPPQSEFDAPRRKARRIPRACDFCHRRSIRCRVSSTDPTKCQNCADFGEPCTNNRPAKKRGVRPLAERAGDSAVPSTAIIPGGIEQHISEAWKAPAIAPQALVMNLVKVYFEVVYPIFPFFHQPTILGRVSRGEYQTNRPLFAVTMAICALSSARARDGAIFSGRWDLSSLKDPPSESFFTAAESAIPKGGAANTDFNYMRACALLSITAIQYGQPRTMHYYLGLYYTFVEIDGLHDEANWPKGIGIVETEERRRLFWSIYTLDVYTSIVWARVVRSREAQSNVVYPTALDDKEISDAGYSQSSGISPMSSLQSPGELSNVESARCWLYGWNFTTDLYRILEHVLDQFRRRRSEHRLSTPIDAIFGDTSAPSSAVLDFILTAYKNLPSRFKETPPAATDEDHRLNFQTANIAATIQLVRIMLFAAEDATVEQRCRVASELLQAFSDVPIVYLRAISSPLLHHLAGIGSILGSVFENGLPESAYQQIRTVLMSLVRLLADLEVGLYCTAGASSRIRTLVERIDESIRNQQQLAATAAQTGEAYSAGSRYAAATTVPSSYVDGSSPLFLLPPDILDDWFWAFDFAQTGD